MKRLWLAAITVSIASCQHVVPHGTIAMKITDNVGQAAVHNVSKGQSIVLLKNECTPPIGPSDTYNCRREEVARGTVSRILNEHYAEIVFPQGTRIAEGQMIEVIK